VKFVRSLPSKALLTCASPIAAIAVIQQARRIVLVEVSKSQGTEWKASVRKLCRNTLLELFFFAARGGPPTKFHLDSLCIGSFFACVTSGIVSKVPGSASELDEVFCFVFVVCWLLA
jgi:hypothetical protein